MSHPKTITTYLTDGNPQGIKIVELSNWIGKAISIPRAKLKEAKDRTDVNQPALYFLFGKDEVEDIEIAYIGEAENLISRILTHDNGKDFRDTVVAFVSKDDNTLTKADVKFLEFKALEQAKKVNRYKLENSVMPAVNKLPEHQTSTMIEYLENIDLLISAMGYPILKEIEKKSYKEQKIYSIKSKGIVAQGMFIADGFIVLSGSVGSPILESNKNSGSYAFRERPKLLESKIIDEEPDGKIIFLQDRLFHKPSGAATVILGRNSNGWFERKDNEGKTLDENERQNPNTKV